MRLRLLLSSESTILKQFRREQEGREPTVDYIPKFTLCPSESSTQNVEKKKTEPDLVKARYQNATLWAKDGFKS